MPVLCRIVLCTGLLILLLPDAGKAQVNVFGKILDEENLPLPGVAVISKRRGTGVQTNQQGEYSLKVYTGDTVIYSFLGYMREFVPVEQQAGMLRKDLTLRPEPFSIDGVRVSAKRNRVKDSLELRREFGHIFGYSPPSALDYTTMALSSPITFLGTLLDFKGRKRNKDFQESLVYHEQQQFIESRIPMDLVRERTGLEGDELAMFYNRFLRNYRFAKQANQYDIYQRIDRSFEIYKREQADSVPPVRQDTSASGP